MDKRKWFMCESPERYTEEGTANVCVHMAERVSKYAKGTSHLFGVCSARCSVHLQTSTTSYMLLIHLHDLQMHVTSAGKQ